MIVKEPCPACAGTRWVCENHPHLSWRKLQPGCECGAGMPCLVCNNPEGRPELTPGFTVAIDDKGPRN